MNDFTVKVQGRLTPMSVTELIEILKKIPGHYEVLVNGFDENIIIDQVDYDEYINITDGEDF